MNNETQSYDSKFDTMEHKKNVSNIMNIIVEELIVRGVSHDKSKLTHPEKEGYDTFIPKLKSLKYGTEEYNKVRQEMMDSCLAHHYQVNRHHPEHFENGISDFTLVDLVEYFVDTYAASLKSDTGYEKGLMINAKKHKLPKELVSIFKNTVDSYGY